MGTWKVAPALVAGCVAILKPSELASVTCLELADICKEVGLPPSSKMKRIGIDTEALKELFGKKIMELEEEKRKVQKSQDVHGQKLKALEAQVQLQYKMKQEAEQFRQWKASQEKELLQLKRFAWRELQIATDNFSERNVLGQGSFRKVYKGVLPDGTKIAELSHYGQKINIILSKLKKQITLCNLQIELKPGEAVLDWPTRKKVALGAARGLEYLHEQCNPKIIHRDVKAANEMAALDMDKKEVMVLDKSKKMMVLDKSKKVMVLGMDREIVALDMGRKMMVLDMDREVVVLGMNMEMVVLDMNREVVALDSWNMEH
ncbi:hypothetical protein Ahy_B05g077107 [Arachis hypogaea]|uniref:Protein kinase domain-containing protein n=1 Tax=Arachis hypogaea TaxID=3818 RepID=A0A444Z4D4_ARAHY|nr:hypothetical protein Ahy_B05g077107 [Arachis hypogaea]